MDGDNVNLGINIISIHKPRFTVENLPDPDIYGATCMEPRTCGICDEELVDGNATDEHWEIYHGMDFLVLKKLSLSNQVKMWNKAFEEYEAGIEPRRDNSFSLDYSDSKFQDSTPEANALGITAPVDRDIDTKLSSFDSKLNDISVTMKQLASASAACADKIAAIPDIITAIAKISTSQARQGSKIETMNSAIEKMERDMVSLQNRSMVTIPGQAEKISASVQKELESSEKKITARVKEEIRISVQELSLIHI